MKFTVDKADFVVVGRIEATHCCAKGNRIAAATTVNGCDAVVVDAVDCKFVDTIPELDDYIFNGAADCRVTNIAPGIVDRGREILIGCVVANPKAFIVNRNLIVAAHIEACNTNGSELAG